MVVVNINLLVLLKEVETYDFPSMADEKGIPYGVYDMTYNQGHPTLSATLDIMGNRRGTLPDAGAFEFGLSRFPWEIFMSILTGKR